MFDSENVAQWLARSLPFVTVAGLLIPGGHWIAQDARTFASLITILVLPGYALARLLRLFDTVDNWFDALTLSVALTWSVGLVLWLSFFFLSIPLPVISMTWLGISIAALVASACVPLPHRLRSQPERSLPVAGIALWAAALVLIAYLYGSLMGSDSYSYMSWLRNITVGDIQPGVNIHASWEADHPHFKDLYAPTLLYYGMSSFLARVDPNRVWTVAPAFWVPVMLAVQFSLAHRLFKHKTIGYAAVFIAPLAAGLLRALSRLGNPHTICNLIFLPLAFWLLLYAVASKAETHWWSFPSATLVAVSLTFEHLPHIVHYLLVVGAFAVLHLLSRRTAVVARCVALIAVVLLLIAPFLWHTWHLATAFGFDAITATEAKLSTETGQQTERFLVLGDEGFFIVEPSRFLRPLVVLGLTMVIFHATTLWRDTARKMVIASWGIAFLIALNPCLAPLLSRMVAPHAVFRLGEALILLPMLAYGAARATLRVRSSWRHTRQVKPGALLILMTCLLLVGYRVGETTMTSFNEKLRGIVYTPAEISPNLTDRLLRDIAEDQLASPPYPILNPPARLTSYLDAPTLNYIQENVREDSVFLSERLTEYNLPVYADQITYLGRKGWPGWGDICPRVREEGAAAAFPNVKQAEVHQRLEVTCTILNPYADTEAIENVLIAEQSEIDYVLVTPNTSYLEDELDRIMPGGRIYVGDGFIIYALESLETS